jgi:hypothetical protein
MDPYLEDPAFWRDFHGQFIYACREQLLDTLPPQYDAAVDEQVKLVEIPHDELTRVEKNVVPDLGVFRSASPPVSSATSVTRDTTSSSAVLEPVTIRVAGTRELKDRWIEVRRREDDALVTVIEVLSPTNKEGTGAGEYYYKRHAILRQRHVNLVEIDLLLDGQRLEHPEVLPPGHYYAFVSRAIDLNVRDVYAWTVRQRLPVIPVPLRPGDADARLDLDAALHTAYDRGRYARRLRYEAPANAGLSVADRQWAQSLAGEFRTGNKSS